ncbi:hypothetical protein FRC18_009317 [Serendipita sp. 400]|nr:hypothetical protein FRC18_009317 [Serendipita sp. 400]
MAAIIAAPPNVIAGRVHLAVSRFLYLADATKGKARQQQAHLDSGLENLELHECDLTCGKLLNCGLHRYGPGDTSYP